MYFLKKKYQVKPNSVGFFYRNNQFEKQWNSGTYYVWDWDNQTELFTLPLAPKVLTIINQEVLTKDSIALRFSFTILYQITDGQKLMSQFTLDKDSNMIVYDAEQRLISIVQNYVRTKIADLESETLNERRHELSDLNTPEMENEVAQLGITLLQTQLRDLTFPKTIQDLFAKHLEAKIRAKSELENARTAVATARTLKNASELMKDDENIKFFQILETITKIAEKGKHTFTIGDIQQLTKK